MPGWRFGVEDLKQKRMNRDEGDEEDERRKDKKFGFLEVGNFMPKPISDI
jgi:hypothetical protein